MPQIVLSNPTIRVNNIAIGFKPNSLSIKLGKGETSVKGVSVGGGLSDVAISENIEDRVSMIKFSLYSTNELIDFFNIWKNMDISFGNDIKIFDRNFNATLSQGVITNDPEIAIGVDADFEVDFKGNIIVEFS